MNKKQVILLGGVLVLSLIVGFIFLFWGGHAVFAKPHYNLADARGKENIEEMVIIGSGPAGLMAAVYGARGGYKPLVIQGNKPGGLLTETTEVENWPGEISIMGPDIIKNLMGQAKFQGARFMEDAVQKINLDKWPFKITTEDGKIIHALSVIIGTGAAPRKLNVTGEEQYWGGGVTSCAVCDAPFYKGEDVVVIGGGDSAVEEAIQLAKFAKNITVLVRKPAMRAAASMQKRLKDYDNISVKYNMQIKEIIGDGNNVTELELYNNKKKSLVRMPISGVFLAIGHDPNTKLFRGQLKMNKAGYLNMKGRTQETSIDGVFAAGDVEDNEFRQAGVSAGRGSAAGIGAVRFLEEIGVTPKILVELKQGIIKHSDDEITKKKALPLIEGLDSLNHILKGTDKPVIVDFFAEHCPSCMRMLPVFESVAEQLDPVAQFVKVDTDIAQDIIEKYYVHKIPCTLVFKEGKIAGRYSGAMSRQELKDFIGQFVEE